MNKGVALINSKGFVMIVDDDGMVAKHAVII